MSSSFTNDGGDTPVARDLRRLWLELRARVERELADAGFADVTAPHLAVLAHPGPEGERPSTLAERAGMSKQAMNHLIGHLERGGYLERRADPADSRARLLHLTARGEDLARHLREGVARLEREWVERIGAARYETLRAALRDLVDAR
jgi:DNA-binding MarR family transcriptional regulator